MPLNKWHFSLKEKMKKEKILNLSRLFLMGIAFAFLGWVWETVHVSILAGELVDRGFLFGPICPIYGFTIIFAYLLLGSPKNPSGILKFTNGKWYKYIAYLVVAILLPTLVELVVGLGFEWLFKIRLWDYSHYVVNIFGREVPLHLKGYIALPISLIWLAMIFLLNALIIPLFKGLLEKIPPKPTKIVSLCILSIILIDTIASIILALV